MATVWKIAPGDNARVWGETSEQGCITINWMNQTDFTQFDDKDELKRALKKSGDTGWGHGGNQIWRFVHDVQPGHTVVANKGHGGIVGIGVVDSPYLPPNDPRNPRKKAEEHRHARLVNWVIKEPVALHERVFPGSVPPTVLLLEAGKCHTIKEAYLKEFPELKETLDKLLDPAPITPLVEPGDDMKELLEQFGQIIVYGPPGTGKTREAKRVALALLAGKQAVDDTASDDDIEQQLTPFRDADRFDLVVFHPAYEYEQFVGGIEPVAGQQLSFQTKPGPFLRLCRKAERDEKDGRPVVLIIDEINRGNLPKLLGELVYALEYRGHRVTLPFDDGRNDLRIPRNLYVFATMNSADRSIGLIDVAIRRRFGLFHLGARPEVVRQVWSKAGDEPYGERLAALMERVNKKLDSGHDPNAADELGVGHSYFLPKPRSSGEAAKRHVEMKWEYQVKPLLREYAPVLQPDADIQEFFKPLKECLG